MATAKEQELRRIIVDLRMQLMWNEIGDNCPHAFYSISSSGCETGVGCMECKRQFLIAMQAKIEKEVALL